jgi:hypothetical protein
MDGHYRYAGTEVRWGRDGVRLRRSGARGKVVHATWGEITGARRAGTAGGLVQIEMVRREEGNLAAADQLVFPVRSEPDSARLLTQLNWYAGCGPEATPRTVGCANIADTIRSSWRDRLARWR